MRNFFVFFLLVAVIGILGYHFLFSKRYQYNPDAPRIDFLSDERGSEDLPLFDGDVSIELLARKTGKFIIQWLKDEDYLQQMVGNGMGSNAKRNILKTESTQVLIPKKKFESSGQGKYWVRAGVLCDDKMMGVIASYLGDSIADKIGYILSTNDGLDDQVNQVLNAYCVGKYRAFVWAKTEQIEELTAETAWYPSEKIIKAGIFEFRLPKSFEPVSINYQPIKNYVNKGLEPDGVDFNYLHGYESARHQITLVLYGVNLTKAMKFDELVKLAKKRIKQGVKNKQLTNKSRASKGEIATHSAVVSDRIYPSSQTKMQTYDILLKKDNKTKNTIAILHEGLNEFDTLKLEEFLNTIRITTDINLEGR